VSVAFLYLGVLMCLGNSGLPIFSYPALLLVLFVAVACTEATGPAADVPRSANTAGGSAREK